MVAADVSIFGSVYEVLAPMWVEVCFMVFFPLGFFFLQVDLRGNKKGASGKRPQNSAARGDGQGSALAERLHRAVEEEMSAGSAENAVKAWRKVCAKVPTNADTMRLVVRALSSVSPSTILDEIAKHLDTHESLRNAKSAVAILDAAAQTQQPVLMEELHEMLRGKFGIHPTYQTYEALLGGHAAAGNVARVTELCAEIHGVRQKLTARAYALVIKGFLQRGLLDAALQQVQAMRRQGFYVPPFAVAMLFRTACEKGRGAEVLSAVEADVTLPAEAVVVLVEDCHRRGDLELVRRVERLARGPEGKTPLPPAAYDALLKTFVVSGDAHALELWEEMVKVGARISEGLCVGLLARCADAKFLRLAEEVVRFSRARDGMTIAVYSALMKVYAYCGLYGRACDLYSEIKERGLTPDSMMYGCLMKFAVEAGRTDLSRELFEACPQLDIQNYMSVIRAAGRDKDVGRAFAVLEKLKASGATLDIAAYNCVLDACVCAGDLGRARALVAEMRTLSPLDVITYNTLLKGCCAAGDTRGAREIFQEMRKDGIQPNDVSYNCTINAAVCAGNFRLAWETVDDMEAAGIKVDSYTVSIMLKALKRERGPREVSRALALLDRAGLDVCADEVLLNSAVETCVRHREYRRLEALVGAFERSSLKPSQHTYGSLIKACSTLQRVDRCRELWRDMIESRGMEPNDIVLGCMLDALVCNDCVTEAVALFRSWKAKVGSNMVMYSTLVKGFAANGRAAEAMEMWREIRAEGGQMNTVVYNALIDAQARAGAMEEVSELVAGMEPDGVQPDAITYSTIVKGYCVRGDLDKAFEVFRSMQKSGLAADCVVYNTVLDGCTRHNRMDLADQVLEDLERNRVVPSNFTLGILVKMHGRRRQLEKAFEVVAELPAKYGFVANAQVKTCLVSACLTNNALQRAFQVFEELKAGYGGADAKAYGVMISGLLRAGRVEQAVQLVEEAYGLRNGKRVLPPGQNIWSENLEQLVRALGQKGLQQKVGVPLLEGLRAAKVPLNGRLLSSAMEGDHHQHQHQPLYQQQHQHQHQQSPPQPQQPHRASRPGGLTGSGAGGALSPSWRNRA